MDIESIAELTQRPLYSFSIGDMDQHADGMERSLSQVLALVTRWKAVLLMDEADVFLETRTKKNIRRNALISSLYFS